jgi:hypothetical protein
LTLKPFSFYDLVETFAQPGCAICNLLLRDAERYLDSLLYEYVTETETNNAFRAGRGLCNEHGWQLTRFKGRVLGTAILYEAAVDEVLKIVEATPAQSSLPQWLGKLSRTNPSQLADVLEPQGPCLVCETLARSEQIYVEAFSQHLAEPVLEKAYRNSDGLCLPHFRHALRQPQDSGLLIEIQVALWEKLKAELGEFIRKNDYNFADESIGAEGDSWLRAIRRMGGEKGIFGLRRRI